MTHEYTSILSVIHEFGQKRGLRSAFGTQHKCRLDVPSDKYRRLWQKGRSQGQYATEKAQHVQMSERWQSIKDKCFNRSFFHTLVYIILSCPSVTQSFTSSSKMIRSAL